MLKYFTMNYLLYDYVIIFFYIKPNKVIHGRKIIVFFKKNILLQMHKCKNI